MVYDAVVIGTDGGSPLLHRYMQSPVPGLCFVGVSGARSFERIRRLVTSAWFPAPAVAGATVSRRRTGLTLAFRHG